MSGENYVIIRRDERRGVDTVWIDDAGRLVCEWLEWTSHGDEDNGVADDHADTIAFDAHAQQRLASALDIPQVDHWGDRLLAEIQKRFDSWFAIRRFATENGIPFENGDDFW